MQCRTHLSIHFACFGLLLFFVFIQPASFEIKFPAIQADQTQKLEHDVIRDP